MIASGMLDETCTEWPRLQTATTQGVEAVKRIDTAIRKFDEIVSTIARTVDDQRAANLEIARNVQDAALGTKNVSKGISVVTKASQETCDAARAMHLTAHELSKQAELLDQSTREFIEKVKE